MQKKDLFLDLEPLKFQVYKNERILYRQNFSNIPHIFLVTLSLY